MRERSLKRGDALSIATLRNVGNTKQLHHSNEQLAVVNKDLTIDFNVRFKHHTIEVNRDLHRAANCRRSTKRNVRGAEDLLILEDVSGQLGFLVGADAKLSDISPVRSMHRKQLEQGQA